MALVEDIRINGQKTSATLVPIIAGLHPVVGWDFSEDEASFAQSTYLLKIGTSSVDWGTSSFSGNVINVVSDASSNFYEHESHGLLRGRTYFGQVQALDSDDDITPWATFSFKTNNLPFVTNFSLSPTSPVVSDDLELSYSYNDSDAHEEAGTHIRWFKNNLHVSTYDDLCILPSLATAADESWTAKIIPSDGLEFGAIAETGAVTILADTSSFESITVLPSDANVDDILKAEWTLTENEYLALTGIVTFQWFVNDVSIGGATDQFARLKLVPGDSVAVSLALTQTDGNILAEASSTDIIIEDVDWHLFDLSIDELKSSIRITDLSPILEWQKQKTTAAMGDLPLFFRAMVTKTKSLEGPIFDTGEVSYTKDLFTIPDDILSRGQNYFIHVAASDVSPIPDDNYLLKEIDIVGSSWDANVDNSSGWTVESKFFLEGAPIDPLTNAPPVDSDGAALDLPPQAAIYIHDGTYFCSVTFERDKIIFHSDETVSVILPDDVTNLNDLHTFRIAGKGKDVKIFMDNILRINATGKLTNESKLKFIEYGDLDGKYVNTVSFSFFRYTTSGAFGIEASLANENVFHFHEVGKLSGGTIDYVQSNLISFLPDDTNESAKLIEFSDNVKEVTLPTVSKNFSPITAIHIDKDRNKYIGTANGVNAIYGEKHDPDYLFSTAADDVVITSEDFDRITTVTAEQVSLVEPDLKSGWLTLDTSYRTIGTVDTGEKFFVGGDQTDPYDDNPYIFGKDSHAIHYYSQRTHGHSWYDRVDNKKGWQVTFSFQLERLEQDDYKEQNIDHKGFGIFINDGTYQEILYFYEDRIRLFYANVFIPIVTTAERNYRIVGKGKDLLIYQKLNISSITSYQLLVNGTGMFNTPAASAGNSRKPRVAFDAAGVYHSVWHDDGNGRSQIFYSSFNGVEWSNPEIVANSKFNLRNPAIATDGGGRIWVAYEDTSWGQTEISVSVRDDIGWNVPSRITNFKSTKANPTMVVDSFDNIHLAWEDNRNGPSQIFWTQRKKDVEAWMSSGQFGEDTVVMQEQNQNDPYFDDGPVQIKNPQLAFNFPRVWLVAELQREVDHRSAIYRGFRDIEDDTWQSMGVPRFDSNGDFIGEGSSFISSPADRNCVNPTIAINSSKGSVVIAWEDQTAPISQIWGSSYNSFGTEVNAPTQITSRSVDCKTPAAGFISNQCAILFESNNQIFLSNFDSNFRSFKGSATGGTDELIQTTQNRQASKPAISSFVPAKNAKIVYDFLREKDTTLESVEFPDYYLIADATIAHAEVGTTATISTSTLSDGIISNIDTTEFAFGDMAENISIKAHWKDIGMYFGYDAKPLSIGKFNSSTVFDWGDDRVNDIFVDTFGNIIVAKFDGLFYHNIFTGDIIKIILEPGVEHVATAVKWGGNGAWFVGTTTSLFISKSAGQKWDKFPVTDTIVHAIDMDPDGNAVCATSQGIIVAQHGSLSVEVLSIIDGLPQVSGLTENVRAVAVDENNIIWTGGDLGLIRIENKNNFLFFNRKSGMRASHVTDIAIVNKHLRYVSTANGIDRMNGTIFSGIGVRTHDLLNNNISQIAWIEETNSLWASSLHSVHEIVFRDPAHEIILDEIVQYDSSELLTDNSFESKSFVVLDIEEIQQVSEDLTISPESASVLINKNPVDFGFSVGDLGKSVSFLTNVLPGDEVEIVVSNKFIEVHDFNQTEIEKKTLGEKRTSVTKIVKTFTKNQTLLLTNEDKNQVLLMPKSKNLPFTTVLLDRDLPLGCMELKDTLTPTSLRFKIIAFDQQSGIDGYMLSNYENFTSDGETPLDFGSLPLDGIVTHSIGSDLNNVTTSFTFPDTVTIGTDTVDVGAGARLGRWTDTATNTIFLYATTNFPPVVWRFDPRVETWSAVARLDTDTDREVTDMKEINNVLYIATGTSDVSTGPSDPEGRGIVYKTIDGVNFVPAITSLSITNKFNTIAGAVDGTVYAGDSTGRIWRLKDGVNKVIAGDIGDEIFSIDVWKDIVIVATGNRGRIYTINRETGDNLVIFAGDEEVIKTIHIKDAMTADTPEEAKIYAGSGDFTIIYRSDIASLDFIKSFSSVNREINRIRTMNNTTLVSPDENGTVVVASMGDSLFKHNDPSWEFVHRHDEVIEDIFDYDPSGTSGGVYMISDAKINKWTSKLTEKTVFLKLRDKAGNVSPVPNTEIACPPEGNEDDEIQCCNFAYALKIADLKQFVNESRIVDITEYGDIVSTFDSPTGRSFYSADEIDQEIGNYFSEILNGSNDLVSWKTVTWAATEPAGTSVNIQIRSGVTEDAVDDAEWTNNLVKGSDGKVSIEHISDQYIQFKAILNSKTRDLSPTLTSVTLRNLTTQASHFFTTNFVLPSRPVKGLLTANTFIPVTADVVFGINTKNTTDFGDYQIIEPNRLFTSAQGQFGNDFRIGIKLLSPGIPQLTTTDNPGDPYDSSSFICSVGIVYQNNDSTGKSFHFRVQFYNDVFRTQLIHTFFSGNDQTGWSHGSGDNIFPSEGLTIGSGSSKTIAFEPADRVEANQRWYVTVDAWDGTFFETVFDDKSYICSSCEITNEANLVSTYYKTGLPSLSSMPQFSSFTPDFTLLENNISFAETSGEWTTTKGQVLSGYSDNFAARFQGKIQAPTAGTYTFELQSSDGSELFINAESIIDHDGIHTFTTATGTVTLTEGFHDIEIHYFERTLTAGLILRWTLPGESVSEIVPSQRLFHAVANEYCDDTNSPKVFNFAVLFELENGETVKLNLT